MVVINLADKALSGGGTTSRQDNSTINDTIITDHESSHDMNGHNNDEEAKKIVYLDENAGMWKCRHCIWTYQLRNSWVDHFHQRSFNFGIRGVVDVDDIPKILNSAINKTLILDAPLSGSSRMEGIMSSEGSSKGNVRIDIVEENEEEILELEFERAVGKMHTHNIYCPNCSSQVTRVILRRKKPDPKPTGLLGCLSCFRIFIPSGDTLNPFRCFRSKEKPTGKQVAPGDPIVKKDEEFATDSTGGPSKLGKHAQVSPEGGSNSGGDLIVDVGEGSGSGRGILVPPHSSKSLEILKSVVYGGLVESITSLSIVSSAAASETAPMNIVALALANVISGVFIIAHNLRDMKNECPVPDSKEQTDRYQELIGKKENFLFHFTFAILSFLLSGLIPPAVYGLAFEKTGNKDYTIIAVAVASLICIILLSIGKAYCKGEHRFIAYFKAISYYVSNAVVVSGVAYAMGDLIKILVEKLGWFEPNTPTPATLFNSGINSATPFLAYS